MRTPGDLAQHLSAMTRRLAAAIEHAAAEGPEGVLRARLERLREALAPGQSTSEAAGVYAQALCYGVFAARCAEERAGPFACRAAGVDLLEENQLGGQPRALVDELVDLLSGAEVTSILGQIRRRAGEGDPIVCFYETFLAAHDPALRESRGVYFTPRPVVRYIVRSVDRILARDFGLEAGLADAARTGGTGGKGGEVGPHRVRILDPAAGTGAFLDGVVASIHDSFRGDRAMWRSYVREHLLPRLIGFELLLVPRAAAHLKIHQLLSGTGSDLNGEDRLRIYGLNPLEDLVQAAELCLPGGTLAEHTGAGVSERDGPLLVVLGNPPYRGHSKNPGAAIRDLLRGRDPLTGEKTASYFETDGRPIGERNLKWLNDDYVKFIRLGHHLIERTGQGILAFITNHGYLDNPTFRGMRASLMRAFDDIYVLDLHGNAKKKERAPDGSEDRNVFDIQQGVAIGIFIRRAGGPRRATVRHADLFGTREHKYRCLGESDITTTAWRELRPAAPGHLFVPEDAALRKEYERGFRLTEIMPLSSVGIATARDALCIHFSAEDVWRTVGELVRLQPEQARVRFALGKDSEEWKVLWAQEDVRRSGPSRRNIIPVLYRPFDVRWTYFTGRSRGLHCRPRDRVMRYMLGGDNLGLVTSRLTKGERFRHVQVTRWPIEVICMSPGTSNNGFLFPLYLCEAEGRGRRRANLAPAFVRLLAAQLSMRPLPGGRGDLRCSLGPEDIFHYICALLSAPSYRARYQDLLSRDFPRIPLAGSAALFRALAQLGRALVETQLLERAAPGTCTYPARGTDRIDTVRYAAPGMGAQRGRVFINDAQCFEGIEPETWGFAIGGYQVLPKWLRSRLSRRLSASEREHFQRMVAAIGEIRRLMACIDAAIDAHGGWPLGAAR